MQIVYVVKRIIFPFPFFRSATLPSSPALYLLPLVVFLSLLFYLFVCIKFFPFFYIGTLGRGI